MSDRLSQLDANQVIRRSGADLSNPANPSVPDAGLAVVNIGGTLVPEKYDQISVTYVAAGNGVGEVETATYRLSGTVIATLTLSYDASNRLIDVVRS